MKKLESHRGPFLLVVLALLASGLSPALAAAEDDDVLVVRYACLIGGRGEASAPTSSGVLSPQELNELLLEWDPGSDNEEVRQVFALNDLGELARQASQLPLDGGAVSGVYAYGDARFEIHLEIRPTSLGDDGEAVKITATVERGGEVLSRPTILSPLGERAIVTSSAGPGASMIFLVMEVDRLAGNELRRRGLRQSWSWRKDYMLVDGEEVTAPVRIEAAPPVYSEEARKAKQQGKVVLRLAIDEHGTVQDVEVAEGLPHGLTEAAVEAASNWRFQPALHQGKPVAVLYVVTVNFRLE